MDTIHDQDQIRCRRLGNEVPFLYCRTETADGEPCRLLCDCWWERFDVQAFIRSNFPKEKADALLEPFSPPNKMKNLVEMIQDAQERLDK